MTKWELFTKVAKAIHEMVNPSEGEIYQVIEDSLDGAYCPTCGSCGETGCCSPDRCNEVICVYGETNLKEYKELLEENEVLTKQLKKAKEDCESYCCTIDMLTDERDKLEEHSTKLKREVEGTSKKKLTWGELADTNTQEYDPSGYPKL